MARFLSDEWIDELATAARAHNGLADAAAGVRITLQQEVDGDPPVRWWFRVHDGEVTVGRGRAEAPDVVLAADAATATAVARGELSVQEAVTSGRLRLGGDMVLMIRHAAALAAADDVFAAVRARTTYA